MTREKRNDCPIYAAMTVIEGKWKTVVLCNLMSKDKMRFNQLMKVIDGVSPRMLTKQLKELEKDGMVIRTTFTEVPLRVEYSLTEKGKSIIPVLIAIADWGGAHVIRRFVNMMDE